MIDTLTIETAATLAQRDSDALLSDRVIDFAAALDEVGFERLRKRLSDGYVTTKDLQAFVRSVKARTKTRRAASRPTRAATRAELPSVMITTDEGATNDSAIDALARLPGLYCRMGSLVRVVELTRRRPGESEPHNVTEIRTVTDPHLRELMSRSARWSEVKEDPNGGETVSAAHPPDWSVKAIQARHVWEPIAPLYHLAESPTLLHDGRVIQDPGYDARSGVLCVSKIQPRILDAPTRADAQEAATVLLELVSQVPFEGPAARSAFIAALLTPIARWAFKDQAPLFFFDANKAGVGKGLLVKIISGIALGRPCDQGVQTDDEDEDRKFITSKVLTAQPIVFIDECNKPFGSGPIQGVLTEGVWSPRLLGTNESPSYDVFITWFAAGNNVQLKSDDITRRTCMIRIVTDLENPAERDGYKIDNMAAHIKEHRSELFGACLTMLRAWLAADINPRTLDGWGGRWGSFDDWDRVVRGAIVFAGLADPIACKATATAPAVKEGLAELVEGMEQAITLAAGAASEASIGAVHRLLEENDTNRIDARGYGAGVTPPAVNLVLLRRGVNSLAPHLKGKTPSLAQLSAIVSRNKAQAAEIGGVRKWLQHRHSGGGLWRVVPVEAPAVQEQALAIPTLTRAERAALVVCPTCGARRGGWSGLCDVCPACLGCRADGRACDCAEPPAT